jgi:tetratricopeptide (TPR) repeat protein
MAANKKQADLFEIHDELRKAEYAINVRKNDLAIEIMMQVLAAHPENSVAFYTIGRAYMQKKLYPQALDAFKEALRLNPADDQAHALCGLALNSLRQYAQAESEAFRAIEIAPSSHKSTAAKRWNSVQRAPGITGCWARFSLRSHCSSRRRRSTGAL